MSFSLTFSYFVYIQLSRKYVIHLKLKNKSQYMPFYTQLDLLVNQMPPTLPHLDANYATGSTTTQIL